jgi:FlaA1/EpsC-like NDP-sugar epimerase
LCRQIASLKPKALVLFEISELALYTIERELSVANIDVYPILGSVNDTKRLLQVLKHFKVDTIYHAAAYKHVPMVEFNNTEGVNNNVLGTLKCTQAAIVICLVNSGITEPLEPNTLPKRTIVN